MARHARASSESEASPIKVGISACILIGGAWTIPLCVAACAARAPVPAGPVEPARAASQAPLPPDAGIPAASLDSATEGAEGGEAEEFPARDVRFAEVYAPEQAVVLADWLAQHRVRRAPQPPEVQCWVRSVGMPVSDGLLCVHTEGANLHTRRIATLYAVRGGRLKAVWQAVVGAWENWLELTPGRGGGPFMDLSDRRDGACTQAVVHAQEKAAAGVHDSAFVDLLRSACAQVGSYIWSGGRYVKIPLQPTLGTVVPCLTPPPPIAEGDAVGAADDLEALREAHPDLDGIEERYVELRLKEALDAFARRDEAAIRAWMANDRTRREERVFGAWLLHRLGADDAKALFVAHYPDRTRRDFSRLFDLSVALASTVPHDRRKPACAAPPPAMAVRCFNPQQTLACAAIAGWPGAANKLLLSGDVTDASATMDNHWLVARVTAARPDEMLTRAVGACKSEDLIHTLLAEAEPATARKALGKLARKRYRDAHVETLRVALLPFLRWRAALNFWPVSPEPWELDCADRL